MKLMKNVVLYIVRGSMKVLIIICFIYIFFIIGK